MALYIVTLAEMKAQLGIGDTVDDAALTIWMEGIQGRFDQFLCRGLLEAAGQVEIFDGGVRALYVKRWPVEAVSEIVVDADQDWSDPTAVLDSADDYLLNPYRGQIIYGRGAFPWPEGVQNIRVTYTGGMFGSDTTAANACVDAAERDSVRRALVMQAGYEWRNRESLGIAQISASGGALVAAPGVALALQAMTLLPEVEQTLRPMARIL